VLAVGSHTLAVTFTPNDANDYTAATASITLTVNAAPSFTLSASSASVAQGGSATSTITVTGANGFSGSVNLSASGLPSGVTASFSPSSTTATSTLKLTASSTAAPGTYTVTITGTSGSLSATTTIALTVSTSSFSCHVIYAISSQWQGGFGAALTIENTGNVAISSWTLTWAFANGQKISQVWNANEKQAGPNVTLTNLSYNGTIAAGGSDSSAGFNGTWNNVTNAVPTSFTVNGVTCK
jgi:Cellulose binding domain